jgi:hypothetical protein
MRISTTTLQEKLDSRRTQGGVSLDKTAGRVSPGQILQLFASAPTAVCCHTPSNVAVPIPLFAEAVQRPVTATCHRVWLSKLPCWD